MLSDWQTFLATQGALVEDGRVVHFGDLAAEVRHDGCILADLSHWGLIQFTGDEAQQFLQGQLTNDVRLLNGQNVQLSGYCTPKGRLLASLLLWQPESQTYVAQLPACLREAIQKRLTMFVLRAKVKVNDISEESIRFGVSGDQAAQLIQHSLGAVPEADFVYLRLSHGAVFRLPGNHFELLFTAVEQAQAVWRTLASSCKPVGSVRWDRVLVESGIPTILPEIQEEFVPQMLNFDLIGAVNFKKGCYPGQEIVARTQYLGKLKRRMFLGQLETESPPQPGDPFYSADMPDQATGMIVNASPRHDGSYAILASLQIASVEQHPMHWKSTDGPQLKLDALPYALNKEG